MKTAIFNDIPTAIVVKIEENEYTVKVPSMGQIIDIEANKVAFSNGQYNSLVKANTIASNQALDMIDTAATMLVLIPELKEDLKFKSIFDLPMDKTVKFLEIYKNQIEPWYSKLLLALRKVREESKEDEKKIEKSKEAKPENE